MGGTNVFVAEMQQLALAGLYAISPLLIMSALIGLVVGFIQSATQIQDNTIPQTIKIIALSIVLALGATVLGNPLYQETDRLFRDFAVIIR